MLNLLNCVSQENVIHVKFRKKNVFHIRGLIRQPSGRINIKTEFFPFYKFKSNK